MGFLRQLFGRGQANSGAPSFEGAAPFENDLPEYDRYTIDRSCVVLHYKEPFLRWVHRQLKTSGQHQGQPTLLELNQDATAYLLERHEDTYSHKEVRSQVESDFLFFFKRELEQWEEDTDEWPGALTLKLFHQCFDVLVVSMVLDTSPTKAWSRGSAKKSALSTGEQLQRKAV
jgi:hypothetical protein